MEGGDSSSTDKASEEAPKRGRGRPRKEKTEEVRQRFLSFVSPVGSKLYDTVPQQRDGQIHGATL